MRFLWAIGLIAPLLGAAYIIDSRFPVMSGIDPATGKNVPVKVAADGTVATSGGGGGGGGASFSNDGSTTQLGRVQDTDTAAGTHYTPEAILVTPGSGGPVQTGTASNPLHTDVAQFGGNPVVTGTGASGIGVPRVTVSNDSIVSAAQFGTWTMAQGNGNGNPAQAWPIQIGDGVLGDGVAAVKPGSTLPSGTDKALVVTARDPVAVTGTFWQATQPVSGTFWQATQPVSGTFWQATQPVSAASLPLPTGAATSAAQTDGTQKAVTRGGAKGTTTAADVTSTASGANHNGLDAVLYDAAGNLIDPRTRSWNLSASDVPACTQSGTWTVQPGNTANTTPWLFDLSKVGGTNSVNGGLAGSQSIGGTSANNTTINQNPVLIAGEVITPGSNPTAATTGNQRRALYTPEGVTITQEGSSNRFSCFVQAVTVTTQCQAAPGAGLRAYVDSVHFSNQAATVQTLDVVFGTGAACATGTTALTHKWQMGTNATTTSPQSIDAAFPTPLVPTAANAICVRPSAATAFGATLTGYTAP